jgi:hypothetical protein
MYLAYYAEHKSQAMLHEAEQRRLAQAARQTTQTLRLRYTSLNALGQQLIRLGTSLTRTIPSRAIATEPTPRMDCCSA